MLSSRMEKLNPYVPGEQPHDREYIKLNANENPYPPSPRAVRAALDFIQNKPKALAVYPDPDSGLLHAAIADMLNKTGGVLSNCSVNKDKNKNKNNSAGEGGEVECSSQDKIPFTVRPDMIYSGNGSDEVLSFVFYAFFDSSERLVCPEFSYSFYPVYCGFYGIPRESVPLKKDWSIDVDEMVRRANQNHSSTIIANPNAPTSLCLSRAQVADMVRRCPGDRVFVVDEAYCDFGGESCIPLLEEFKNLVIVRTFSKSLCGAGMRSGYIVAAPELVNAVTTVKNSLNHFPMDAVTQVLAAASCADAAYYVECAKKVVEEREAFIAFLRERGWSVLDSSTNFVFTKKDGASGKKIYEALKKNGILVRRFDTSGIEDYLRVTIGSHEEMAALKAAWEKI